MICLVGAGPRGLAVLERLCANHAGENELVIHVVDPFPPGSGRIWREQQSPQLLMNTVSSQVSQFTDESIDCSGPIRPGPSLHGWLQSHDSDADQGRRGPDDYPSRRLYGRYLRWVFDRVVADAPDTVRVVVHRATAVALEDADNGQCVTLDDGNRLAGMDAVVLSLGHSDTELTGKERQLAGFAERHGLRYFPPANPADLDFDKIDAGEAVGVRGLGLAFFDVLALVMEGRGGRFVPSDKGLRYRPSGREPTLYAGAHHGIPDYARGRNQKGVAGKHRPRFLTADAAHRVRENPEATFRRDVWPLLDAEVRTVYYQALVAQRGGSSAASNFLKDYLSEPDDPGTLRRHGLTASDEWSWERLGQPWRPHEFSDHATFNQWLLGHLREDIGHAEVGNVDDPVKAALDVIRDLHKEIRLAIDRSGVIGSSYRDEVIHWFTPLSTLFSAGPPPLRVEQMAALIECGLLQVVGPEPQVRTDPTGACFLIGSTTIPGKQIRTTSLIEARIPKPDLKHSANPLLCFLVETGQCRPYHIPDPDGAYESGGLDVTPRPYRLIDAAGVPHSRRFAYGPPTESVFWFLNETIRPGIGSMILEDADAISRAALTC